MPRAETNGIEIDYERRGDPGAPAVLLVMGLGGQRIMWPDELIDALVDRDLDVIWHDNRDVGHSTWFDDAGKTTIDDIVAAFAGETVDAPYALSDMAADAVGLLDVLEIDEAHVVGASMGGMIAQLLAVEHPERVASLTSIMSTTGARDVGQANDEANEVLLAAPPQDRDAFVEWHVDAARTISGPLFDETRARDRARRVYDRAYHPQGASRQLLAILVDGDRTSRLQSLDVPALVVHGEHDPLIDVSGGRATAEAIPGARFVGFEDMGHDLPAPLLEDLADLISEHVHAAERKTAAA